MADNSVNLATPTGIVAADDISGVLYQRIKLGWGADGTWNETADTTGKEIPVKIASSQMGSLGQAAVAASVPMVPASGTVAGDRLPANMVSGAISTAMTSTTSTSLVAAPGASLRNYITTIIVSNAHATVGTDVLIQDGSGGTTLLVIPAAAVYGGAVITLPTPLRQPTTNTALFCANVTTGASTKVSAVGYKAA